MRKCPKCGSVKVKIQRYMGTDVIECKDCGYDEALELDIYPEDKTSQKAKGNYSPYKTGGKQRTR